MTPLWTGEAIAAATGGDLTGPMDVTGVSIDTRTLQPGDLFIALRDQRDGHDFVAQALGPQKKSSRSKMIKEPEAAHTERHVRRAVGCSRTHLRLPVTSCLVRSSSKSWTAYTLLCLLVKRDNAGAY